MTESNDRGYELPDDVKEDLDPNGDMAENGVPVRTSVRGYDAACDENAQVRDGVVFDVNGAARRVLKDVSGPKVVRGGKDVRLGMYNEVTRRERMNSLLAEIGPMVSSKFRAFVSENIGKSALGSLDSCIKVKEVCFDFDLSEIGARGVVDVITNGILPSQMEAVSGSNAFAEELRAYAEAQFKLCLDNSRVLRSPNNFLPMCVLTKNKMSFLFDAPEQTRRNGGH